MKKLNTPYEVQQLDVEKSKNLVTIQSIKLTTAAAEELAKVPNNLRDMMKSFRKMLQTVMKKNPKKRSFVVQTCLKCCLPKPIQSCHS